LDLSRRVGRGDISRATEETSKTSQAFYIFYTTR
jgi:hypothetical protein